MRYLVIILILAFGSCTKKETIKNGRLKIIPIYCKYDNSIHFSTHRLKLFKKGENSTEIKLTVENKIPGENNFVISNLEYGKYYIEYITIYNQKNIVDFELNQSNLNEVKLCLDHLDYNENKNVLLIDELKQGETLNLTFFHQGCFDTYEKPVTLYISKKNEKISVDYYNVKYNLTNPQFKLLREFEIELRSNHNGGCSSNDTYSLFNTDSYSDYEVSDGSCEWRGFDNLIKTIIGKK